MSGRRSAALPASIEPTISAYVDAFEWFFVELGLERPHVAGNSMGGAIALELARGRSIRSVSAFSGATSVPSTSASRSLTDAAAPLIEPASARQRTSSTG